MFVVRCLGGHFGHDISKCQQSNIEKQLQKTKAIINNWNKRNLSIIGKITIDRCQSYLTLPSNNLYINQYVLFYLSFLPILSYISWF
jgi:hypothetical protein